MKCVFAAVLLCCACYAHAMEDDGQRNSYLNLLADTDERFARRYFGQMEGPGIEGPEDCVERLCDTLEEEVSCYNCCCLPFRCLRVMGGRLAALLQAEDQPADDHCERVRFLLRDD